MTEGQGRRGVTRHGGLGPVFGRSRGGSRPARRVGLPGCRGDGGQAAVELVLVLPLVAMLLLLVVQVALVARDQVLVVHAAREGARQAAVDREPGAPRKAALQGSGLDPGRLAVATTPPGDGGAMVVVTVRYQVLTDVPIVGALLPEVDLGARAAMRTEW